MNILFYPDMMNNNSRLFPICRDLKIDWHNNPSHKYDYFFLWSYTKDYCKIDDVINNYPKVFNRGCYDVTKSRVEKIFKSDSFIDPETHNGICVKKSELQADKSGEIVKCPRTKERGYIYQKYIDTTENGKYVYYRIFYSGQIDFIVKTTKGEVFTTNLSNILFEIVPINKILTQQQIDDIVLGCKNFGMDFGELDVLIDEDKKIYVVDVNNVAGNTMSNQKEIMELYKKSFVGFLERNK